MYVNISTHIDMEDEMSRVQLALNVTDLDEAVGFYTKLFDSEPAKRKPGYANFAIENPPLKLVLIESEGAGGTINHLGVEVESSELVASETSRLQAEGIAGKVEDGVVCCYAEQDKVWATGPDAERWEVYTVLADAEEFAAKACC
jgi:catechol 2,3-dioxygenase-like lactoylglutathione lyase family enzyme